MFRTVRMLVFLALPALAGLYGCVTTGSSELSAINQRLIMVEERVYRLEQAVEGYKASAKNAAEMGASLDAVRTKVGQIQGKVEEQEQKLAAISNQLNQLQEAARKSRETSPQPPVATPPSEQKPEPQPKPSAQAPPASKQQPTPAEKTEKSEKPESTQQSKPAEAQAEKKQPTEKSMYEEALSAYNRKDFNSAEKGFQEFLKKYPDSPLADDATFWLGEIHFTRGNLLKAIEQYQKVIDVYPKGNKVPMALYKQGKAWEKLGDSTAAKILYEKVVKKYPNSSEAKLAQQALDELNKGKSSKTSD
ncbi:MAG: tol-pal system protein YbgF [Thermodesulforhabdaceae bacterium]